MSNSSLATYRRISPHNSGARTEKISKITIHHMSGRMTAKQCADYFAETSNSVSSNYCIGWDGSIAVSVDEDCRAWTSSSRWNDQRAVTIETSNVQNSGDSDWKITDAAMQSLIALCVDICKRNGIKRLYYDGTTSGTLTRHCQFADTDCPGPYIKRKTDYICDTVNAILNEIPGDINGDGKVNTADARLALRFAARLAKPTAEQLRRGDLDRDGKITSKDARAIMRKAAKL